MKSEDELYKIIKKEEEINRKKLVYKAWIRSPGRDIINVVITLNDAEKEQVQWKYWID